MGANMTPRAPIHQAQKHGFLTHRDAIWAAIRGLQNHITTRDIEHRCGVDHATIKNYVLGLERSGYLECIGSVESRVKKGQSSAGNAFRCKLYRLANDVGVHAPRVDKHGDPVIQGRGRQQMWQAMRVLGEFCASELHAHVTQCSETSVKDYIKRLARAGYLAAKRDGRKTRYRLVRNTGPLAPMIQRTKAVFDPNARSVVWQMPDGDVLDAPVDLMREVLK